MANGDIDTICLVLHFGCVGPNEAGRKYPFYLWGHNILRHRLGD